MFSHKNRSPLGRTCGKALVLAAVISMAACGHSGPASRGELCGAYKRFQSESQSWHPISNSGVFRSLRNLGDVAARYEASQSVQAVGPRLKRMGSADSFSLMEAQFSAAPIAAECLRTAGQ